MQTIENVRYRDILIERFGFHGNQTLESIGEKFNVTRERIRQIEEKQLQWLLRRKQNKFILWYKEIIDFEANYPLLLELNMLPQLDDRFSGHQNTVTLIESLTEAINKYATLQSSDQLQCSWFSGAANGQKKQKYLCYLHEMEIGNIDRMIKDKLPDLEGLSVEEAKKHAV